MTEEELEDEICEYVHSHYKVAALGFSYRDLRDVAEHFALPREKQIQIDAEQIRALQKQNGELTDRVKELEAQIEKMKCCGNCAKNGHICVAEETQGKLCGKNKDKWELRR